MDRCPPASPGGGGGGGVWYNHARVPCANKAFYSLQGAPQYVLSFWVPGREAGRERGGAVMMFNKVRQSQHSELIAHAVFIACMRTSFIPAWHFADRVAITTSGNDRSAMESNQANTLIVIPPSLPLYPPPYPAFFSFLSFLWYIYLFIYLPIYGWTSCRDEPVWLGSHARPGTGQDKYSSPQKKKFQASSFACETTR